MLPLSRPASRVAPRRKCASQAAVAHPSRRRAHSVPVRPVNHGQQRCDPAPQTPHGSTYTQVRSYPAPRAPSLPKRRVRVRFSSPAPFEAPGQWPGAYLLSRPIWGCRAVCAPIEGRRSYDHRAPRNLLAALRSRLRHPRQRTLCDLPAPHSAEQRARHAARRSEPRTPSGHLNAAAILPSWGSRIDSWPALLHHTGAGRGVRRRESGPPSTP